MCKDGFWAPRAELRNRCLRVTRDRGGWWWGDSCEKRRWPARASCWPRVHRSEMAKPRAQRRSSDGCRSLCGTLVPAGRVHSLPGEPSRSASAIGAPGAVPGMGATGRPGAGTGRARNSPPKRSGQWDQHTAVWRAIAICRLAWLRPCGARTLIDVNDSNPYSTHD